jgi:hypothetical protein
VRRHGTGEREVRSNGELIRAGSMNGAETVGEPESQADTPIEWA